MNPKNYAAPLRALTALCTLALVGVTGCGGGSATSSTTSTSSSSTSGSSQTSSPQSTTTVSIGDAPLEGVLSFQVSINNVVLTGSKGNVTLLSSPATVEVSHLAGTFQPLILTKIPADTYSQVSVTFGASELLYLPPGTKTPVKVNIPALSTPVNLTLNPAVTISGNANSLKFDLKVAQSLSIDSSNNVTFSPVFTLKNDAVAASNQEVENGKLEDIKGMIATVSGSQFTIAIAGGSQTLTFNTDSTTVFDPAGATLANLPKGTVVEVSGVTQQDGSFLAKKIEVESQNQVGLATEGLVTSVTGSPATSFQLVARDCSGAATVVPNLGSMVTVNVDSNTTFRLNGDAVKIAGSSFNFASAADLAPGQNVEADADSGNATGFTAKRVQLDPQTVDGTVAQLNGSQFQLTLAANSTLAKLTGATSLTVLTTNAENSTGTTVANGQAIRVRGFLFFGTQSGATSPSYTLVAFRLQNQ